MYEAAWIATPCGTFSPLREKQPGPRVLRTLDHITGVPGATKAEEAQLRDANVLVHRSYKVADRTQQQDKPWGIENPDHPEGKPSLWLMPRIKEIPTWTGIDEALFDQCVTGLETTKPTKLLSHRRPQQAARKEMRPPKAHLLQAGRRQDPSSASPNGPEEEDSGWEDAMGVQIPGRIHHAVQQDPCGCLPQEHQGGLAEGGHSEMH